MTDKNLKMIGYSGQKKKAPASSKKLKQAYAALILGLLFIPLGLIASDLIQGLIDDGIADFIKTPKPSDEGYSDFLTDDREGAIPMYTNYYMHNLTNANATLHGATPEFDEIGPYCYRVYSYKYQVNFNDDYSEVTYKSYSKYVYQPELSGDGLNPSDIIQNINPGYLGVLNLMDPTLVQPERTLVKAMLPSILSMVKSELLLQIETLLGEVGVPGLDPVDIFY